MYICCWITSTLAINWTSWTAVGRHGPHTCFCVFAKLAHYCGDGEIGGAGTPRWARGDIPWDNCWASAPPPLPRACAHVFLVATVHYLHNTPAWADQFPCISYWKDAHTLTFWSTQSFINHHWPIWSSCIIFSHPSRRCQHSVEKVRKWNL